MIPVLTNAGARGTLVAIDSKSGFGEFRISCGRYVRTRARVQPGLWRVDLRRANFGWAVGYNARGGGHVEDIPLKQWLALVERVGWTGTLYLHPPNAPDDVSLTNGGSTDVCAGVFG
jgi:hypothetical protein